MAVNINKKDHIACLFKSRWYYDTWMAVNINKEALSQAHCHDEAQGIVSGIGPPYPHVGEDLCRSRIPEWDTGEQLSAERNRCRANGNGRWSRIGTGESSRAITILRLRLCTKSGLCTPEVAWTCAQHELERARRWDSRNLWSISKTIFVLSKPHCSLEEWLSPSTRVD